MKKIWKESKLLFFLMCVQILIGLVAGGLWIAFLVLAIKALLSLL